MTVMTAAAAAATAMSSNRHHIQQMISGVIMHTPPHGVECDGVEQQHKVSRSQHLTRQLIARNIRAQLYA
jgi:hypothetical protein